MKQPEWYTEQKGVKRTDMENLALLSFAAVLLIFLLQGWPLIAALLIGLLIFSAYALKQGFSVKETVLMWRDGVLTAKNVLLTFCFIGALTGIWRACGTIPAIVYYAAGLIRPSLIIFLTFFLNCLISFLMGTSFGAAATMGLICMTMARTMGVSPAVAGGAVLSGIYFGDRCSPVSTSALLTAEITGTGLYGNIRRMLESAFMPVLFCGAVYFLLGLGGSSETAAAASSVRTILAEHFDVSWPMLLPAVSILILAGCRVPVRKTLFVSIVLGVFCAVYYQDLGAAEILEDILRGFQPEAPELRRMLAGGGIASMFNTAAVVLLGACYSGIFEKADLLSGLQGFFEKIGRRFTPAAGVLGAGILSALISCNQTLAIMMTKSLCQDMGLSKEDLALAIEDTAVVIAGLVPWSIACAAPLAFIDGTASSIPFAFYLYTLPAWHVGVSYWRKRQGKI